MTLPLAVVGLSLSITTGGPAGQQVPREAVVGTVDTAEVAAHVRPLTPVARQLVRNGLLGSPSFRALVRELADTDIVVLVVTGQGEAEEGGCHANLRFLAGGRNARFVRVWVDAWWRTRREQTALLAHELRHAVEIGLEPDARNATAVAALFRRIGQEYSDRRFETLAARETEAAVCAELGSSRPAVLSRTKGR